MPGVKRHSQADPGKMSYLLVDVGAAGAALVEAVVVEVSPPPQPVNNVPTMSANSTIRAYILFIVAVDFTKSAKRTSKILCG